MWWEAQVRQLDEQLRGPGLELCAEGPGTAGASNFSTVLGRLFGESTGTPHYRGVSAFTLSKREIGRECLSYCAIAVR